MAAKKKKKAGKEYPTGYDPSALPFYEDLDAGRFEQFCADLLNLRPVLMLSKDGKATERNIVEANRLLGGNPQKGGDIRAKDDQGAVWIFQCKHVKAFGETEVSEAIELLEEKSPQADQYVLVTTCGLSEKAQAEIHARPKWHWWDSSRLTTEVLRLSSRENASNLVRKHFGPDCVKRLFPCSDQPLLKWQEFFQRELANEAKHFRHTIPFIPWSNALAELESFAQTGAGRALILSAPGGQGKSRLLLELAQSMEKLPSAPRVRFLNLNQHGLDDKQSDFLAREEGDLLLIVDDAHRMGAAIADVARAAAKAKTIRLLIATRPQAVEAIRSQLYQNGYDEKIEEPLSLPPWRQDDIRKLAERVLAPVHRFQAPILVELADLCPLLVVLGASLVNSGEHIAETINKEAFRERVFKSFINDFLNAQPETKRERLRRVIKFLSFVSPAPKNDALLNNAAAILNCIPLDIDEDLGALETAGLVVKNREGIRLYPDLFADAVLLDACLGPDGKPSQLHQTILDKLKLDDFPALMRNIAQADWEARSRKGIARSLFDPIWQEFVRRFEKAAWFQDEGSIIERYLKRIANPDMDRSYLLTQWEPVAVFLPEKTLELASLAITSVASSNDRVSVCRDLPPLLKPIVVNHPDYASRALDLLWSLAAFRADGETNEFFRPVNSIAEAAAFAFHKPIEISERVLAWLEKKIAEPSTIELLHRQPWILSALLKPFFVREVQNASYPGEGNTVAISTFPLPAAKAHPLRQRALTIIEQFLKSPETILGCAVVPALEEAIKDTKNPLQSDQESWRQERLDVFKVIEGAIQARQNSPTLLLQLRGVLRKRWLLDKDPAALRERDRVLNLIPDTFELRVNRLLASSAPMEFGFSDYKESERQWTEFARAVAREAGERWKTAHEICEFLRRVVSELKEIHRNVDSGAFFQQLAQLSPAWCAAALKELVGTDEPMLERGLLSVLSVAFTNAPEAYRETVEFLPMRGRSAQLCELILFLGWKQIHGGGLVQFERDAVLSAVNRSEETVVCELAVLCGHRSGNDPKWAMDILSRLHPVGERSGNAIMEALGYIVKEHALDVEGQKVAECLGNLGKYCFPESGPNPDGLTVVAQYFPRQAYEHIRRLCDLAESDSAHRPQIPFFGPLGDTEYVDREILALWKQAAASKEGSSSQQLRLDLMRSLIWADKTTAPERLRQFVTTCKDGSEIKLFARLAGSYPPHFVFDFPDIVRAILARGQEVGVASEVTKTLVLSACGRGQTYTGDELDPESKYILEQGDALANRYRNDPLLQSLYRAIANYKRHDLEWQRQ